MGAPIAPHANDDRADERKGCMVCGRPLADETDNLSVDEYEEDTGKEHPETGCEATFCWREFNDACDCQDVAAGEQIWMRGYPRSPGKFWLYGWLTRGGMETEPRLRLLGARKVRGGQVMYVADGAFIDPSQFVGYFMRAAVPEPPESFNKEDFET